MLGFKDHDIVKMVITMLMQINVNSTILFMIVGASSAATMLRDDI